MAKRKAEQILDGLLAQVMIDAEDARFGEGRVQRGVELLRRGQVAPEGFLDDHARALGAAGFVEALDHGGEHAGRDGQVVRGMLRRAEQFAQRREGGRIVVVAVDVLQELDQLGEGRGIEAAMLRQAVLGARRGVARGSSRLWRRR